jgi:hypothetical protein
LLYLGHDLVDLRHVALTEMRNELGKKLRDWRVVRLQQRRHIVFVETDTGKVSLPVK